MKKESILYGLLMGLLLIVLQLVEYKTIIRDIEIEVYATIIAVLFLILGIWLGRKIVEKHANVKKTPTINHQARNINSDLSKREFEVLQMMARGMSNKEIAEHLFVSLNTIKTHASNIYLKLDVKRRTQAINKAREMQLL
ncbi:MAG: response regulator transcription factor [Bacteroidota bacterium]